MMMVYRVGRFVMFSCSLNYYIEPNLIFFLFFNLFFIFNGSHHLNIWLGLLSKLEINIYLRKLTSLRVTKSLKGDEKIFVGLFLLFSKYKYFFFKKRFSLSKKYYNFFLYMKKKNVHLYSTDVLWFGILISYRFFL